MKKILLFLSLLLPWFLSSIFVQNAQFYNELVLPIFAPPAYIFGIIWPIIYFLIAISSYQIINEYGIKEPPKSYYRILLINYLFNQSFPFVFFYLENTFLGFVSTMGTFITSLFLYEQTTKLKEKSNKFLNLYLLWGLFATALSLSIYVLNAS